MSKKNHNQSGMKISFRRNAILLKSLFEKHFVTKNSAKKQAIDDIIVGDEIEILNREPAEAEFDKISLEDETENHPPSKESLLHATMQIKQGTANGGIVRHSFSIFGDTEKSDGFSMIEKRIKRKKIFAEEFLLYKTIKKINDAGLHVNPLPNIFLTAELENHYSVLMPFYQGINTRLKNQEAHGKLIAQAVFQLNSIELEISKNNRMAQLIDITKREVRNDERYTEFSTAVIDFLEVHSPEIFRDQAVKSHNDLYFPNISTEKHPFGYNIVFIDFGLVAYNQPGADFHHFIRSGARDKNKIRIIDAIIEEYAMKTGKEKSTIAFNAHCYSLLRVAARLRGYMAKGDEKSFSRELELGWDLHKAACLLKN